VNLSDPEDAQDAATKTYVDTRFTQDKIEVNADKAASRSARDDAESAKDAAQSSASSASDDADATAADRIQTGLDASSASDDADATAADRIQTGLDAAQTNADAASAEADAITTAEDRVQTGLDRIATESSRDDAEGFSSSASAALTQTQAARDAVLAAFDNFDDRYLGAYTSDPTTDNDGDPLVAGTLYFNETDEVMKVFTGSLWVAAYVTGTDFVTRAGNLSDLSNIPTARINLGLGDLATKNEIENEDIAPNTIENDKLAGVLEIRTIPQRTITANTTLVLGDAGGHILHPSADTTARVCTIPANSSVGFPVGAAVTFTNQNNAGVLTIAITGDTLRFAGDGGTGSRTLAANGMATALKIAPTEWMISGAGLP
jgi:hypothetical protein